MLNNHPSDAPALLHSIPKSTWSGTSFCTWDLALFGVNLGVEFRETNVGRPNFWPEFLGCNRPVPLQNPRTPKLQKCILKTEKCHFGPPRKKGPNYNVQKARFGHFTSWTFKLTFGAPFPGVRNGVFRTLKCTLGVSGFRGSVGGPGDCNPELGRTLWSCFLSKRRPKIQPRNRAKWFTLHLCRASWNYRNSLTLTLPSACCDMC